MGREASINGLPTCRLVVQIAMINALERLGSPHAVQPLCELLVSTEIPELRYTIIQALGGLGNSSIVPLIEQYAQDANQHVREHVAYALARLMANGLP